MDYNEAIEYLSKGRNKNDRPLANNTRIIRIEKGVVGIKLHDTYVVTLTDTGLTTLNTGGWRTVTTRDRINRFAPNGISLSQVKFIWYIHANDTIYPFEDHMSIDSNGMVHDFKGQEIKPISNNSREEKRKRKELNQITKFTKGLLDKFFAGEFKDADKSRGDCLVCQFQINEAEHMRSHLKQKYYQRSIITNAIGWNESTKVYGLAPVDKHNISCLLNDNHEHELMWPDLTRKRLQLITSRYIRKELGYGIT